MYHCRAYFTKVLLAFTTMKLCLLVPTFDTIARLDFWRGRLILVLVLLAIDLEFMLVAGAQNFVQIHPLSDKARLLSE